MFLKQYLTVIAASLLAACSNENPSGPSGPDSGATSDADISPDAGDNSIDTTPVILSEKARLKFKGGRRYAADLSRALDIPESELCQELGAYDCVQIVHRIALGGVEPYRLAIHKPLSDESVSAPIAADRVALSACEKRAALDFEDTANARFFTALAGLGKDGDDAVLGALATQLYRALVARSPSEAEKQALGGFFAEVVTTGTPAELQQYGALSCFAVATTMEALFY